MSNARRGVKIGLHTLILGTLVTGTATVVVAQVQGDAALAADSAAEVVVDREAVEADIADGSADVPMTSSLAAQDVQHVVPASRSQARDPLLEGVTFTLVVDGVTTEITTAAATLGEALTEAGVALGWEDQVTGDLTAAPEVGAQIHVGRATTTYVTDQVVTPHEVEERKSSTMLEGETRVVQEGVDGDERVTSEVSLVDGVEVSRTTVVAVRTSTAVTEIVEVGTRKPVVAAAPRATTSGSGTPAPATPAEPAAPLTPADPGSNRAIAQELLSARGWDSAQWSCLDSLWQKESNWNHLAKNKSSGAYGIPQSLPGNKMASVGSDWQTNPATQITWGLNYIEGRYGNPCGAWDHSKRKNWY
ncbi:hypothetical protein C8046_16275 [Serinibacter arcticus]|uniref:G5 domain-containing protein n=1 Tax=Serinibacter arcticus TaxID=1655435 RepID=A0A2U1ZYA3_9MICO|nr:G5 domain-containing protein [Serinibacter arcticus]PWD51967.1 hypothetical protein C8046_16275 [Serinibacter arcticus]